MENQKHDIVFPIGTKSFNGENFELKVAISSIRKYCSSWVNRIIISTQISPIKELGDDIVWVKSDDVYTHDKDANIIHKIRCAIEQVPDLTDDFMMWSDDQFVTKETSWEDCRPRYMKVYDESTLAWFNQQSSGRLWYRRLVKCFQRFPNNGFGCKFFNPHIPAPLNKVKFMEMCNTYDYKTQDGITIYSLYYNFVGEDGTQNFDEFHCTKGETDWKNCRWVGYYDSSLRISAFRDKLKKMFL